MLKYIGQTLFEVICGAVNMPVAVQYVLSSIIYTSNIYQFCKHNYDRADTGSVLIDPTKLFQQF